MTEQEQKKYRGCDNPKAKHYPRNFDRGEVQGDYLYFKGSKTKYLITAYGLRRAQSA